MYTRLVWFVWWLDAAAHFAVFNVDRESGRDVKVKNETQMPLFSPASSAWSSIWVSPVLRCTARRRRCLLAFSFDFS